MGFRASPVAPDFVGESFNGRITGLHPVDEGSNPFFSTKVYGAVIRAVQEADCEPANECSTHSRHPKLGVV